MTQAWPPLANSYLRRREEDYISALLLSTGLGLSIAGALAFFLRSDAQYVMRIPGAIHTLVLVLLLSIAIPYYSAWGSRIRRRLRKPLHIVSLVYTLATAATILFMSNLHVFFSTIGTLAFTCIAVWFIWKKLFRYNPEQLHAEFWIHAVILSFSFGIGYALGALQLSTILVVGMPACFGAIAYAIPYRPWAHFVWHFFAIAYAIAYYSVMWQSLT